MTLETIKSKLASTLESYETMVNKRGEYFKITVMLPFAGQLVGFYPLDSTVDLEAIALQCETLKANRIADALYIIEGSKVIIAKAFEGYNMSEVTIPGSVTKIMDEAFQKCRNLKKVEIYQGVKFVGKNAFCGCSTLRSLRIADSVEEIQENAFSWCKELDEVYLPAKLRKVADSMFYNCTSLKRICIPEKVTTIGAKAFRSCKSLEEVEFPEGLTTIEEEAFVMCEALQSLTLRVSIRKIGEKAFLNCSSLKSVNLLTRRVEIGASAFAHCTALEKVHILPIRTNLVQISDGTFEGCVSLKEITWTKRLKKIGNYAFNGCISLGSIDLPEGILEIGTGAFQNCTCLGSIALPPTLKKIGSGAFKGCRAINNVIIPASVSELGCQAFWETAIPSEIIHNNILSYVPINTASRYTIPKGIYRIESYAFKGTDITDISIPESVSEIGSSAFEGCKHLRSVRIPSQVSEIESYAFSNCISLQYVILSGALVSIGEFAFYNCPIQRLAIPQNVQSINRGAFRSCSSLIEVDFSKAEDMSYIEWGAFAECTSVVTVHTTRGLTWSKLKDRFRDSPWGKQKPVKLTAAAIKRMKLAELENASYRAIVEAALAPHHSRVTVELDSIKVIAELPFNSYIVAMIPIKDLDGNKIPVPQFKCDNLKALVSEVKPQTTYWLYPQGTVLTQAMTQGALPITGITRNVVIMPGVTKIDDRAFDGFRALQNLSLPSTVETIGSNAFQGTNLKQPLIQDGELYRAPVGSIQGTYTVPENVQKIKTNAFSGCFTLEEVIILKNVTLVEENAFKECVTLKRVVFENPALMFAENVKTEPKDGFTLYHNTAFSNCSALKQVVVPNHQELTSQLVSLLSIRNWI